MPRRMPNILSLDLDWFNWIKVEVYGKPMKKQMILDFFAHLRLRCTLPTTVAIMTEHHYLYPWCAETLKAMGAARANIYNVDEHHDFYWMSDIDDFNTHIVSCANFFAFMAHHGMIGKYHWITNDETRGKLESHRRELKREFRQSHSRSVKAMGQRHTTNGCKKIWDVLDQKTFDGFAIVKSLDYTMDQDVVFSVVDRIMKRYFTPIHGVKVGRNKCRADYWPQERPSLNVKHLLSV